MKGHQHNEDKPMKWYQELITALINLIGRDNNRFYGLLLFIALMFALWLLYAKDTQPRMPSVAKPNQEQTAGQR